MAGADGQAVPLESVPANFCEYVLDNHEVELMEILMENEVLGDYSVTVNFMSLLASATKLAEVILLSPAESLPLCDQGVVRAATTLYDSKKEGDGLRLKLKLHARITGLPVCPELHRRKMPNSHDVGRFLCFTATVVRSTVAKLLEYKRNYECTKCKHVFTVEGEYEHYYHLQKPATCPSPEKCKNTKFTALESTDPTNFKDYQEIKIQEQVQMVGLGTIPRQILVSLENDIVSACKPGDDIVLCGLVVQRWRQIHRPVPNQRPAIELFIRGNSVQVTNEQQSRVCVTEEIRREFRDFWETHKNQPLKGRDVILSSFCPQVFGMYLVKLSVSLILCGGVRRVDKSGSCVRGEPHLLMVGDPGTGKSQFLRYAAKLSPRSVLTTGVGTTSAGLTVAAVKDSGEWQLEAGALVLSDGGICCIDEFNSMREKDKAAIHEAMEQQTISVAKAGLVCKLSSRCSVLAATNPKGQYDHNESISVNVALASPLLSRFDLVLILVDNRNPEWDRKVSSYILGGQETQADSSSAELPLWSLDKVQSYIRVSKGFAPQLSSDAGQVLSKYYQQQRRISGAIGGPSGGRTTIRLLESLIRLSQAHARLMHSERVEVRDTVQAIILMECSMQGDAVLGGGHHSDALHKGFPEDPDQEYQTQGRTLLTALGLSDIWAQEEAKLAATRGASGVNLTKRARDHSHGGIGHKVDNMLRTLKENHDRMLSQIPATQANCRISAGKKQLGKPQKSKEKSAAQSPKMGKKHVAKAPKRKEFISDDESEEDAFLTHLKDKMRLPPKSRKRLTCKSPQAKPTVVGQKSMVSLISDDESEKDAPPAKSLKQKVMALSKTNKSPKTKSSKTKRKRISMLSDESEEDTSASGVLNQTELMPEKENLQAAIPPPTFESPVSTLGDEKHASLRAKLQKFAFKGTVQTSPDSVCGSPGAATRNDTEDSGVYSQEANRTESSVSSVKEHGSQTKRGAFAQSLSQSKLAFRRGNNDSGIMNDKSTITFSSTNCDDVDLDFDL